MSSVPEEIYLEILLTVTVKSTFVCKCVCKSWFQLISNPSFVKMHLNIAATQRKNYNLMFRSCDESKDDHINWTLSNWKINSISYDALSSVNGYDSEIVEMVDYPFSSNAISPAHLLGSCNGLVCLLYGNWVETHYYLYNPATKEYKKIPKSRLDYWNDFTVNMITAFGYDCNADDYKIINVVQYCFSIDQLLDVDVYTLGSNSWESSQPVTTYRFSDGQQTGIFVNGAVHWFGEAREKNSPKVIISMKISNKEFSELQLPEEVLEKKHLSITIGVMEGCLCLVVMTDVVYYEVWMMKDYGVQECWTEIYTIDNEITDHESPCLSNFRLELVHSFKNGQILLKHGSWLVIYDPIKQSRGRKLEFASSLNLYNEIIYVESLVSLDSGTYAGRNNIVGT